MQKKTLARISGILLCITFFCAPYSEFHVRDRIVDFSDSSLTASNVLAASRNFKYQLSFSLDFLLILVEIPMLLIFHYLLKPVNKLFSVITACFRVFFLITLLVRCFVYYSVLILLSSSSGSSSDININNNQNLNFIDGFSQAQINSLSLLLFKIHFFLGDISMILLSLHVLLLGILIFKSQIFPKFIGLFMSISFSGYFLDGIAFLYFPQLKEFTHNNLVILTSLLGDPLFCLYLLIFGVRNFDQKKITKKKDD
ncbi:hypothetical protein M0813_11738 [Anaeramoeba flamelloides]|uniref:DUF4386 domain-containing protein n=1 Tax=Anaeramoeba flamelloides TaxID=1746091 RepID=A0ABQ8ZDV9_9EUKA|nr:hypothetical protein M0813_11738 [Anaeramoeba flamelloides]